MSTHPSRPARRGLTDRERVELKEFTAFWTKPYDPNSPHLGKYDEERVARAIRKLLKLEQNK